MTVTDERETLINKICNYLMPIVPDIREIKNTLYMLTNEYEITSRCTEIAVQDEERNEYLLKKFLIAKTVSGRTPRTVQHYKMSIRLILRSMQKTVDDITADDIRYYMAIRQRRDKVTKTTIGNEVRCLSSFMAWLNAEEILLKNPMLRVEKVRYEQKKKKALTELEIEQLRAAAEGEQEKMIIEVLQSTGCRVTELSQILLSEIDGTKVLIHGKGQKERYVYLNAKAEVMLEAYLSKRQDTNPYLLPGMISIHEIHEKELV